MIKFFAALTSLMCGLVFATAVAAQAGLTPSTIPTGTAGVAYPTQTFSSTGSIAISWTMSDPVPGLTFTPGAGTATLSGTPTTPGTYKFTLSGRTFNGFSQGSFSQPYTLVVNPAAQEVPTLSDWAMILFGTVLAGGAALYIQRRRFTV